MSNFRGIWIALVTPMRANEIDFAALEKLVKDEENRLFNIKKELAEEI